jgi:hypothetical protein
MDMFNTERARARRNVRTALMLAALAIASLAVFVLKVWRFG